MHVNFLYLTKKQSKRLKNKKAILILDETHETFYGKINNNPEWIYEYKTGKMMSSVLPIIFCMKDDAGNYILSQPTDIDFCENIDDYMKINNDSCRYYSGEKKQACEDPISAMKTKVNDCFSAIPGKESAQIDSIMVEKNCKIIVDW